jgi:alkylmercury lyase
LAAEGFTRGAHATGLFIPQILQTTARVESTCPVTGSKIRLTVTPEGVQQLEPAETVMSFVTPDSSKMREEVILHFCHYVYFFRSAETGAQWITQHPRTFLLSMEEAVELARKKNALQYRDVLESIHV